MTNLLKFGQDFANRRISYLFKYRKTQKRRKIFFDAALPFPLLTHGAERVIILTYGAFFESGPAFGKKQNEVL